jgi:hypothetical protein
MRAGICLRALRRAAMTEMVFTVSLVAGFAAVTFIGITFLGIMLGKIKV